MDNLMNTVKQRATAQLDTQKTRATDGLSVIAGAVRRTTEQLRNEQHDGIAEYVDRAADQIEHFSAGLRDKDVNELLQDARQFARRQPALFIGGSFAVGLLTARFLKSSQRDGQDRDADERDTYRSSRDYGYGSTAVTYPPRDAIADVDSTARGTSALNRER
jgi:hypothetical protein